MASSSAAVVLAVLLAVLQFSSLAAVTVPCGACPSFCSSQCGGGTFTSGLDPCRSSCDSYACVQRCSSSILTQCTSACNFGCAQRCSWRYCENYCGAEAAKCGGYCSNSCDSCRRTNSPQYCYNGCTTNCNSNCV